MSGHYHYPVDPECPEVQDFMSSMADDPITVESGCGDEIIENFERQHRARCKRCREYSLANLEVEVD